MKQTLIIDKEINRLEGGNGRTDGFDVNDATCYDHMNGSIIFSS
jgi:hypothetical protein